MTNPTTVISILRTLRKLIERRSSPLKYTSVTHEAPFLVHQIQPKLILEIGKCEYPYIDASAFANSTGHGYAFYFNCLYIFVEVQDGFYL